MGIKLVRLPSNTSKGLSSWLWPQDLQKLHPFHCIQNQRKLDASDYKDSIQSPRMSYLQVLISIMRLSYKGTRIAANPWQAILLESVNDCNITEIVILIANSPSIALLSSMQKRRE